MQVIYCIFDVFFVVKRLGEECVCIGVYFWCSLLDVGVVVINGIDVLVEDVDFIESYYVSVMCKCLDMFELFFFE